MGIYNFSISREFLQDFERLPNEVEKRTNRTIDHMMNDPWAPELHSEKVKSAEMGVYSARVDDKYRIIWKHIKPNDILFCLVDNHDEAYRRAARKSFVIDNGMLRITDITEVGAKTTQSTGGLFGWMRPKEERVGALFVGYRDPELIALGVPEEILSHVRTLDDVNQLPQIERLLPASAYDKLLEIALDLVERPGVKDEELRESLERHRGGDELYRFVNSEEFKRALSGDMQEWMLFLAAPQRFLVTRSFNGPVRVRGVVGSGKTVVAIHRTRHLAREAKKTGKKVLFLTYGNRLPGIIHSLLSHLIGSDAPELDAIECRSLHSWCARFLSQQGQPPCLDEDFQGQALTEAIQDVKSKNPDLKVMTRPQSFFADEIRYVIKGKVVNSLEEYLNLGRVGRKIALREGERRAVFEVYQLYQNKLETQGCCDYDDFILKALELIQIDGWQSSYQAAVVDELQDMTEANLRLIRAIVPSGPNDLFLVGDGLQRIYPGGVSLNRIQIDITGRAALLRRNYRNTQEILRAAHAMMERISFDDLDETTAEVVEPEYSLRHGDIPVLRGFSTPEQELMWIQEEIQQLQSEKGYRENDFGIFYRYRKPYQELLIEQLKDFHLVELQKDPESYFGEGLKHTTFHSAKGLEFKVVFVVGVTDGQFVPKDDWTLHGDELEDYYARERRLLYVAMTRARDILCMSYSRGQPSRFFADIPTNFLRRK